MHCELGDRVGYSIRFEDCVTPGRTQIKYLTEGLLIREMMRDPLLNDYSVIMVDETHERTMYTDIILGLIKKLLIKRKELRLIVSSATLESDHFLKYFSTDGLKAAVLKIEGRTFPVDVYYLNEPVADYLKAAVNTVIKIHETQKRGDILVFLTGQDEVEKAIEILKDYGKSLKEDNQKLKLYALPFYASLPAYEQLKVFETFPRNTRKVVCSTNLAETSLTINGIVYVVDCGFVKLRYFNTTTGTDALVVVPVSQASARQRQGRAGRTLPGKAFRLYTERDYKNLLKFTPPELQRSDLSSLVLQLKALGISNLLKFDFPSRLPEGNLVIALELLYALGCLSESGALEGDLGLKMAEFPLTPQFSKMLLSSGDFECSEEILSITAMLQIENIFQQPSTGQRAIQARNAKHAFSVLEGDTITYLNIYNAFVNAGKVRSWADKNYLNYNALLRVVDIRTRLANLLRRMKVPLVSADGDLEKVQKCIVSGFFANAAKLQADGSYRTIRGNYSLHVHPLSVIFNCSRPPQYVLFTQVLHTSKQFIRDLTAIKMSWLYEIAPQFYVFGTDRQIREAKESTD